MTRRQRIIARILFVVYLAAVAWLCFGKFDSMPDVPREFLGIPIDKIVHFAMFFPFPILAFLAFDRFTGKWWVSLLFTLGTFLTGALIAAGTEVGQARLTSYRSGDPKDYLADLLALGISSLIVLTIDIWKQRKCNA
jgi:VanZ family protein